MIGALCKYILMLGLRWALRRTVHCRKAILDMSLRILVALSLQILFLFTILKCMLAKWVDFQIKCSFHKTLLWYSGLRYIFIFPFIFFIISTIILLIKVYPGDYWFNKIQNLFYLNFQKDNLWSFCYFTSLPVNWTVY